MTIKVPTSAKTLVKELELLERSLGNLPAPVSGSPNSAVTAAAEKSADSDVTSDDPSVDASGTQESREWAETRLEALQKRAFEPSADLSDMERRTETLFAKICRELHHEGHSAEMIAAFINDALTPTSSLKYCSPDEVNEVIGH